MTPAISEPRGHLSADPLRVLVLEDNPADAELILRELRRAGYEVSSRRTDSEDGFLKLLDPLPQLILADYTMPTFDALSALRLLRERDLDIPFIIVSGMIGEDVAVFAMRNGAADYLFKDRLARLGPAVTNALEQKRLRDAKWKSAERMIDDLRRLNRAVHAVHAERGPQVLQRIADVTRNLAAADFSVLALLRHDQSEFETFTV